MKASVCALFLSLTVSATSHAVLLSCESNDLGESNGKAFTGYVQPSSSCSSGYGIKVGRKSTCLLTSATVYEGEVRGCGYFNGSAFVATQLLPLGAE